MPEELAYEVRQQDGIPIVEIFGDADLNSIAELEALFSSAAAVAAPAIVVSLLHAKYFDSSTVAALLTFAEHLRMAGRRLLVVGPSGDSGRRILSIFDLKARVQVVETIPEAVAVASSSPT